jgi:hypothetical protein
VREADALAHGARLLRWMQEEWFSSPAYLTLEERPVLLVFGPQYFRDEQWAKMFAGLNRQPQFFTLHHRRGHAAVGGFDWPLPRGGTEQGLRELDAFYARAKGWPRFVPAAFPRFHDIYREAGVHDSYGFIADRGGKTYEETLERALKSGADVVQLVTWNDWGEGTMIEPSVEFGYRDLEATQRLRRRHRENTLSVHAEDLRLPVRGSCSGSGTGTTPPSARSWTKRFRCCSRAGWPRPGRGSTPFRTNRLRSKNNGIERGDRGHGRHREHARRRVREALRLQDRRRVRHPQGPRRQGRRPLWLSRLLLGPGDAGERDED